MTPKVAGGHAISLRVRIPSELVKVAQDWVADNHVARKLKISEDRPGCWMGHLTLCFVGRDLPEHVGEAMLDAVRLLVPPTSITPNQYEPFGYKKDHLAVTILDDDVHSLRNSADLLKVLLIESGVKLRKDFPWNPHVTLATGESKLWFEHGTEDLIDYEMEVVGLEVKIGNRKDFIPL